MRHGWRKREYKNRNNTEASDRNQFEAGQNSDAV